MIEQRRKDSQVGSGAWLPILDFYAKGEQRTLEDIDIGNSDGNSVNRRGDY